MCVVRSFVHSYIRTFVHSCLRTFVHIHVRSFVCLLVFPKRNQCSNVYLDLVYDSILID